MKTVKEQPEEEKQEIDQELPKVVDPDENGNCPIGYFKDSETGKCILDVG